MDEDDYNDSSLFIDINDILYDNFDDYIDYEDLDVSYLTETDDVE